MPTFVTIGPRLVAPEHIALVELYEASANPRIETSKRFLSRVLLINRDSLLSEDAPAVFVDAHGFRMLPHDNVAINPRVNFQVEQFVPKEGFTPTKAWASRLLWRDLDGNQQSKLMLTEAELVFAVVAGDHAQAAEASRQTLSPAKAQRRRPRQPRPEAAPH